MSAPSDEVCTIALAQLSIEPGAVEENLERATAAIERAASRGADLICLPELFTVGYFSFDRYDAASEALDGPTGRRLASAAADNDVAVLGGSVVEDLSATTVEPTPAASGLANTAVLYDSSGARKLVYRKHHLFGYDSKEAELLVPGDRLEVVDLCGFTVGVTTCYDLRFPSLYRSLVDRGVTLVLVPSAWPYPRIEHWTILTRARAIENQWYLAAVNGSGAMDGSTLLGRSTVYDPWGNAVASSGDEPTLILADLDPARVRAVRDSFPALRDRRR